jgi:hypothetical protein
VQSQAQAPVSGTGTALSWAAIGNGAVHNPAMVVEQSVATFTAEPASGDVNNVLANNANIKNAFTAGSPTYFGIGEMGGAYSTGGSGSETETSSVDMTVDLTKVSPLQDLLIGFYSGSTAGGAGFTSMTLDVNVNGVDHINTFTTVAAADAFFNNGGLGNAVDYGKLSGTSLQLDISLSITEAASGGYTFGLLVGDPPAALGQAAASFKSGGGNVGGSGSGQQDHHTPTLVG